MIQGQKARISAEFRNDAGNLADPTSVFCRWRVGNGAVTEYQYGQGAEIVKDATGQYHFDIDTTAIYGTFVYRWRSSGNIQTTHGRQAIEIDKAEP